MKRTIRIILILTLLLAALCVTALADGIYITKDEAGILTPLKADGSTVTPVSVEDVSGAVYTDAVKLRVNLTGKTDGKFYLLLAMESEDASPVPTAANLRYIDQGTAADGSVEFTLYPDKLESGKTYGVYISSNAEDGTLTKVAEYKYYQAYKLGDIDMDTYIDTSDALLALRLYVRDPLLSLTDAQKLAADVTKNGAVDTSDALAILRYYVKNITSFSEVEGQ